MMQRKIFNARLRCDWCRNAIDEILMLHVDLWPVVCDGRVGDIMCCACIKQKLGREPTLFDRGKPWWPKDRNMAGREDR